MKIGHTADWHIYDQHKYSVNNSRLKEIKRNILLMIKYCIKNDVKLLFVAGDIFEIFNPSEKLLKVLASILRIAIDNGIKIRILMGNHDTDGIEYSFKSFKTLYGSGFEYQHHNDKDNMLLFFGNERTFYFEDIGDVRFVYVPWNDNMSDAIKQASIYKNKEHKRNILITHCAIDGAVTSSNYEAKHTKVTQKLLSGWDLVLVGDFHKNQKIGSNIYYSGSPVKISWDERDDQRMFNVFETDDCSLKRVKLPDVNFIQMELHYTDIDQFINTPEKLTHWNEKELAGSFVKVLVSGKIGMGEKLVVFEKYLYDCKVRNVNIRIIDNIKNNSQSSVSENIGFNLDIKDACLKYLEGIKIQDKDDYKKFIVYKIMETK